MEEVPLATVVDLDCIATVGNLICGNLIVVSSICGTEACSFGRVHIANAVALGVIAIGLAPLYDVGQCRSREEVVTTVAATTFGDPDFVGCTLSASRDAANAATTGPCVLP